MSFRDHQEPASVERELHALRTERDHLYGMLQRLYGQMRTSGARRPRLKLIRRRFFFEPTPVALRKLHTFFLKSQDRYYGPRLIHAMGQVAFADDQSVRGLLLQLISFANGARSLAGLESLYLSCLHNAWLLHDDKLYAAGAETWSRCKPPKLRNKHDLGIMFFDRATSMITFLPWESLAHLNSDLLVHGFFGAGGIAGSIRGNSGGYAADNPFGWSYSKCLGASTGIATAVGGTAGLVVGGAVGLAETGGNPIGGIIGGYEGMKDSAAASAAIAGILAGILCSDDKPASGEKPKTSDDTSQPEQPDMSANAPPPPASSDSSSSSSGTTTETPTATEEEQGQSLPEEHPECSNCGSGVSSSYPQPDGPDDGTGSPFGPLASLVEIISFPTDDGDIGGTAGGPVKPTVRDPGKTLLIHDLPRLGVAGLAQGFLSGLLRGNFAEI